MSAMNIIEAGESETTEFKTSLAEWRDVVETISAFSNRNGGSIFVGVGDDCGIVGVDCGKSTIENLANQIKQNTDPVIYPSIRMEEIEGKTIIVVDVKEFEQKPVLAFGRAFMRVGKSSQKLGYEEIRRLAILASKVYWDGRTCRGAALDDVDEGKVKWFLEVSKYERRLELDSDTSVRESLNKLNLLKEGNPTNAAILLFGKDPQKFFAHSEIRCARFKGTKPLEFIDMKIFGGNLIDQREDVVEFVKEHIKLHAKIEGVERVETWEYPIDAIRESITNAICHRDYEVYSNVQVRIFDDRIEVWGCGSLPEPLTLDELKQDHMSILRNPLIGNCFFWMKFIEHWGTGTNRIIDSCVNHGLPEPIFEQLSGSLVVTLRNRVTEEALREMGLNERQLKALSYIEEKGSITNKEYQMLFDVSRITGTRDLNSLEGKDILKRIGTGKRDMKYVLK